MKHIVIVLFCTIASWLGPIVLINSKSNFNYLLAGLFFSLVFVCIYHFILGIEKLLLVLTRKPKLTYSTGFIVGVTPVLLLLASGYIYMDTFFRPIKGIALLNVSIICLLIILLFVYNYFQYRNIGRVLFETSLFFLLPIALIYLGFIFLDTSESEVIFGNVGLVYFFLISLVVRTKEEL